MPSLTLSADNMFKIMTREAEKFLISNECHRLVISISKFVFREYYEVKLVHCCVDQNSASLFVGLLKVFQFYGEEKVSV